MIGRCQGEWLFTAVLGEICCLRAIVNRREKTKVRFHNAGSSAIWRLGPGASGSPSGRAAGWPICSQADGQRCPPLTAWRPLAHDYMNCCQAAESRAGPDAALSDYMSGKVPFSTRCRSSKNSWRPSTISLDSCRKVDAAALDDIMDERVQTASADENIPVAVIDQLISQYRYNARPSCDAGRHAGPGPT